MTYGISSFTCERGRQAVMLNSPEAHSSSAEALMPICLLAAESRVIIAAPIALCLTLQSRARAAIDDRRDVIILGGERPGVERR